MGTATVGPSGPSSPSDADTVDSFVATFNSAILSPPSVGGQFSPNASPMFHFTVRMPWHEDEGDLTNCATLHTSHEHYIPANVLPAWDV